MSPPERPSASSSRLPTTKGPPAPSMQNLASKLQDIRLSEVGPEAGFIGGFRDAVSPPTNRDVLVPERPLPPTPSLSIPNSLRPGHAQRPYPAASVDYHAPSIGMPIPMIRPAMPSPITAQSLAMTYARSASPYADRYSAAPFAPLSNSAPMSPCPAQQCASSGSDTNISPPLASPRPAHRRSASTPSTSGDSSPVKCSGITKAGKRCARAVRAAPLVSVFAPESGEPIERFCYQHVKEIMEPSGFYSHKENGGWVEFADWIPSYLHPDTQAALRVEMERPASAKDEPGYIYAFEIREDASDEIRLKVGRAVKLVKRVDEWAKQCSSKEVILRGWWPGTVEDQDVSNSTSLLRGKVKAGEAGPLCHRLERLVHLELADLAVHAPYLKPGFPRVESNSDASPPSPPSTPGRSPKPSKAKIQIGKCIDCGQMHKEIFTFQRAEKGRYKNAEWERIVKPVISKWGDFVRNLV